MTSKITSTRTFKTGAAALAIALAFALTGAAEAGQRQMTRTGPNGGSVQKNWSHVPGSGTASCNVTKTGPQGNSINRSATATRNGDGTATVNRSATGPQGQTGSSTTTISRTTQ